MTMGKTSLSGLGWAIIGLIIISLVGIAILVVIVDDLAESGQAVPSFFLPASPYREAWKDNGRDEFTREATARFFGQSIIPVGVDLISRAVIRYVSIGETPKRSIRHIIHFQRKSLMPLQPYLSILASGLGILHLILSSCAANPLPELSLFLLGILVASGLLSKWNAIPDTLRKILNKFHNSLIITMIILVVLFTGHAVMDMD